MNLDRYLIDLDHIYKLDFQSLNLFFLDKLFHFFIVILFLSFVFLLIKIVVFFKSAKDEFVTLKIQALKDTRLKAISTDELLNLLGSTIRSKGIFKNRRMVLEISSTKKQGITYLIKINKAEVDFVKKALLSYLPGIEIQVDPDYPKDLSNYKLKQLKLRNHFAFPLKANGDLEKHDPITYLTGNMTKLKSNEVLSYQLAISTVNNKSIPDISRIRKLIYKQKDLSKTINNTNNSTLLKIVKFILFIFLQILLLPIGLMVFVATDAKQGPFLDISGNRYDKKNGNPYQQELEKLVKNKLDQTLFKTSIRVLSYSPNPLFASRNLNGIVATLTSLYNSSYQSLVEAKLINKKVSRKLTEYLVKHNLLSPFNKTVLSASEVSSLFHFPFNQTNKTEDLIKQNSRQLPAPISLKGSEDLDIVFAKNTYGGKETKIGLKKDERRRHMYIIGATGTGKSTMLLSMINQDVKNDKGLAVIDPHGDLAEQTLNIIPKDRIKDVVYFNPDDISYPIGINLLELSKGLSDDEAIREKEYIAESIISLFNKLFDKYTGPRMEYILRNTIHTAFYVEDATLFTIYELLVNTSFRNSVVRNIDEQHLKDFWKHEFAKAGDYQKVKMIGPITNKIGRFLFSPTAKRILEQKKSTIDFNKIMDEGKILLCNLSKGKIGEDNSEVFGIVLMTKIQLAALKRARQKDVDRKDFYLYVDEFQNFATPAFAQILSEARKYRLNAILAHQTTSQLEDKSLVNVTLANTGTVICFRTANPEDERLILPQFRPYIEKGEIANLPSYHFYIKLGALNPEEPFSGITIPVDINTNNSLENKITESSRACFAKKYIAPMTKKKTKTRPKKVKKRVPKTHINLA